MFGKGLGKIESKRVSPFKLLKFHNVSNTTVLSKGSHTTLFRNRRNGYDVSLSLYAAHGINISNTISLSLRSTRPEFSARVAMARSITPSW